MQDDVHPTHGLLNSGTFMNKQLLKIYKGAQVELEVSHHKHTPNEEGDFGCYSRISLTLVSNKRICSVYDSTNHYPRDVVLSNSDLSAVKLCICPCDHIAWGVTGVKKSTRVALALYNSEDFAINDKPKSIAILSADLVDRENSGLLSKMDPVFLEFTRRRTIENAVRRIAQANETIQKHMVNSPYTNDD